MELIHIYKSDDIKFVFVPLFLSLSTQVCVVTTRLLFQALTSWKAAWSHLTTRHLLFPAFPTCHRNPGDHGQYKHTQWIRLSVCVG